VNKSGHNLLNFTNPARSIVIPNACGENDRLGLTRGGVQQHDNAKEEEVE
jgi:hypothetical protein